MGAHVVETRLPTIGQHQRGGYGGECWAIVRHESTEDVEQAVLDLVRTVQIRYACGAAESHFYIFSRPLRC